MISSSKTKAQIRAAPCQFQGGGVAVDAQSDKGGCGLAVGGIAVDVEAAVLFADKVQQRGGQCRADCQQQAGRGY